MPGITSWIASYESRKKLFSIILTETYKTMNISEARIARISLVLNETDTYAIGISFIMFLKNIYKNLSNF